MSPQRRPGEILEFVQQQAEAVPERSLEPEISTQLFCVAFPPPPPLPHTPLTCSFPSPSLQLPDAASWSSFPFWRSLEPFRSHLPATTSSSLTLEGIFLECAGLAKILRGKRKLKKSCCFCLVFSLSLSFFASGDDRAKRDFWRATGLKYRRRDWWFVLFLRSKEVVPLVFFFFVVPATVVYVGEVSFFVRPPPRGGERERETDWIGAVCVSVCVFLACQKFLVSYSALFTGPSKMASFLINRPRLLIQRCKSPLLQLCKGLLLRSSNCKRNHSLIIGP